MRGSDTGSCGLNFSTFVLIFRTNVEKLSPELPVSDSLIDLIVRILIRNHGLPAPSTWFIFVSWASNAIHSATRGQLSRYFIEEQVNY